MTTTPDGPSRSYGEVAAVAARTAQDWQDDPNVIDVTACIKVRGGVAQPGAYAVGFRVRHKVPVDILRERGWRLVPDDVDGIVTDVIATHRPALGSVDEKDTRSQLFDTLIGGIAVGNAERGAYGTLGMSLLTIDDGRLVGLTNEHVLVSDGDGKVGDDVLQPRFYLNAEVSLEPADCCPDGQLVYRGVDNPVVDAAIGVFAAAAIAAAASDEIDPHRRGQDATPVDPGERTSREVVRIDVDYPEVPLPGTAFTTEVRWRYERHTDQGVRTHAVAEEKTNPHHTAVQLLVTDRNEYSQGEGVLLGAALGPDAYSERCNYLVTAAVMSPSGEQALKTVLRPWRPRAQGSAGVAEGSPAGPDAHGDTDRLARSVTEAAKDAHGDDAFCLYLGSITLPKTAELGRWRTFLYAHTLNDVPAGTRPEVAARTIGGLPVTANFIPGGRTSNIDYGDSCELRQRTYGTFTVREPRAPDIR